MRNLPKATLFATAALPQVLYRSPDDHPNPSGEPVVDPNAGPGVDRVAFPGPGETGAEAPKPEATPAEDGPPEGYDSWEAYGRAVVKGEVKPEGTKEETPAGDASVEEALKDLPEASREKAKPFFEEFASTGTLTTESKKAAAEAFGVSEAMVDQYMAGYQTEAAAEGAKALAAAGVSQEDYAGFAAWAKDNLSVAEQKAFDEGLDKDPSKTLQDAIASWKESGQAPGPRDITRQEAAGKDTAKSGAEGYASVAEMTRDMNNPLYAKDAAFRAKVEKRVAASDFSLGKDVGNQ